MRAAGLARPDTLRDADLPVALRSLSPLTKHDLREAGDAALRDGRASRSWFSSQSSGSSGEPFRVYYDARAWSMLKYLVKMRSRRAAGVATGDRIAILDAIPISAERNSLLERAGRLRRISVFRPPAEIATLLAEYQPGCDLCAPLGAAGGCTRDDAAMARQQIRVRRIFTSGELLTGAARSAITSAFGCALFDIYGTSETKEIAWECAAGSRHINADVVHVEILDEHGAAVPAGIEGEIVVTLLVNRAMPLIRYRTGDRSALLSTRCTCGRDGPLLGAVTGREADSLELPDGSMRSPYQLTMALEGIPGLAQYQIVQARRDLLWVNAVAGADTRNRAPRARDTRRPARRAAARCLRRSLDRRAAHARRSRKGARRASTPANTRGRSPSSPPCQEPPSEHRLAASPQRMGNSHSLDRESSRGGSLSRSPAAKDRAARLSPRAVLSCAVRRARRTPGRDSRRRGHARSSPPSRRRTFAPSPKSSAWRSDSIPKC